MYCRDYSVKLARAVGVTLGLGVRAIRMRSNARSARARHNAGVNLYDSVWKSLNTLFFNREQLADFSGWRHRFDGKISCLSDGELYANRLAASLGDRYTRLLNADETGFDQASQSDKVCHAEHIGGGIAMIVFHSFDAANVAEQLAGCLEEVRGCSRLIIDMRENGGGWMNEAWRCCSLFLDRGSLGSVDEVDMHGRLSHVRFELDASVINRVKGDKVVSRLPRLASVFGGKPVLVLVSKCTASASEVMLGCLQSHGVVKLVGETTRGKGIEQGQVPLDHGYSLSVTRGRWHLPNGEWLGDAGMTVANGLRPSFPCTAEEAVSIAVNLLR